jgi:hypothetical protein
LRKPLPQSFPRTFRGEQSSDAPQPRAYQKYEVPSVLAQYRVLSIVFGILALALAVYFIKWMFAPSHPHASPLPSVYIEMVPPKTDPPPTDPPRSP